MEREAVLVGIDVGTSKVCALIGEVSRDGSITIIGKGSVAAAGLKKGVVVNIDQTVHSIASAVAILAALDSVLGAVRAELDGVYDNRIFISGFLVNAIVAVLLTFIGDRLGLDLYLVALITFGLRIFDNVALIRRHFL